MTEMSPAEPVFFAALAKLDPAERAAYLDEVCGADADLRCRVDRLLAAHPQVGSFLQDDAAVHPSPLGGVWVEARSGATVLAHAVDLGGTQVSDAALKELAGVKKLHMLLDSTKVTNEGLKELTSLKSLRAVNLRKAGVTEEGVRQLQKALPESRIVHDK